MSDHRFEDEDGRIWYEYRYKTSFVETNIVGNLYFAHYFDLMGKCRDIALEEVFPTVISYLDQGFGLVTEFAHIDYHEEGQLYDSIAVRMGLVDLSRTRLEFEFRFVRDADDTLLATGKTAVIWINQVHRPSIMPDELQEGTRALYGEGSHTTEQDRR